MREIPPDLIDEIDSLLGMEGHPYQRLVDGQWVETGCYQWGHSRSPAELMRSMSPELSKAWAQAQESLVRLPLPFSNPMKRTRKHILRNSPHVLDEYDRLMKDLEEADKYWLYPLGKAPPSLPPDVKAAVERIAKKANKEMGEGDGFDLDAYSERIRQLWEEEPEEVRASLERVKPALEDYANAPQRASGQRMERHLKLRSLLKGKPFFAYGDVIVVAVDDQFEILRIEGTNGANHGLQTEDVISALRQLDSEQGVDILNAGFDHVTFAIRQRPTGEEAIRLGEFLLELCPDLIEAPSEFPDGVVELWWD